MLRSTQPCFISKHFGKIHRSIPNKHEYRELSRWQRESSGLTKWQSNQSKLVHHGQQHRFNPNWVGFTKGTPATEAQRWLHYDQMKLPLLPPEGYRKPRPMGRVAWPPTWTDDFAEKVFDLNQAELREYVLHLATQVIHEETQRDGIELRRLDMEGNPLTELPSKDLIHNYVLEELTIRDRVIERVLEDGLRIVPDSQQLAGLKTMADVINFAVEKIETCRIPKRVRVTDAVLEFLEKQPIQPEFGYQHARPQDTRKPLVQAWEQEFHYAWQFGNADYKPRTVERNKYNPHWIDAVRRVAARARFETSKVKDELREAHLEKIRAAAEA